MKYKKWTRADVAYRAAVTVVMAVFLAICLHAVANYWQWGHNGYNSASYAQAARNTLRFGIMGQAKYHTGLKPPRPEDIFTHHPMMIHLHLVTVFKFFGYSELAGRLIPAIYSFLSMVLLFIFVRRYWGRAMALAGITAYALIPLNLIFANMIDHEQGSIFWTLAFLYAYTRWFESRQWSWFALTMLATSVSLHFGWPGYFVALVVVIHAYVSGRLKHKTFLGWRLEYTFSLAYSVVVLVNFYLFYLFIVGTRGSFDEMMVMFRFRTESPGGYWGHLWDMSMDLQGPIFLALLCLWVPYFIVRVARWKVHLGDLLPLSFLFAQIVQSTLFKQAGHIHSYWTYHAGPVLAVGGAAVVLGFARLIVGLHRSKVVQRFASRSRVVVPNFRGAVLRWGTAIAIVAALGIAQAAFTYKKFWWGVNQGHASYKHDYNDQFMEIEWVKDVTKRYNRTNARFYLPKNNPWRIEWQVYLDAPFIQMSSSAKPPARLLRRSKRNRIFLFDLAWEKNLGAVSKLVARRPTIVWDRRFVLVNASVPKRTLEAYIHVNKPNPFLRRWFVNPNHPPIAWKPDPNLSAVKALFQVTVEVEKEMSFGGQGGKREQLDCLPGTILQGFEISMAKWGTIDHVGGVKLYCRRLEGKGLEHLQKPGDRHYWTENLGAKGEGKDKVRITCNDDEAVIGIFGRSGKLPDAIGIICMKVTAVGDSKAKGGVALKVGKHKRSRLVGGDGGGRFNFKCPPGTLGWGFLGRVGSVIDAFGISCARINRGFWGPSQKKPKPFK